MIARRGSGRRFYRHFVFAVVLVVAGYGSWQAARSEMPPPWAPEDARRFHVERVIDGDTIVVRRTPSAEPERLRYIGIDAPELAMPPREGQDFAPEALEANARLVEPGPVWVAADREDRDEYGRLLGYVFADGVFVNEYLVAEGFAEVMLIEPNVRYATELMAAQEEARRGARGLWGRVRTVRRPGDLDRYAGSMVSVRGDVLTVIEGEGDKPSVLRMLVRAPEGAGNGGRGGDDRGAAGGERGEPGGRDGGGIGGEDLGGIDGALAVTADYDGPPAAFVTLLVFPEVRRYFPEDFPGRHRGRPLEVTGRLERGTGGFQIIVREPGQLKEEQTARRRPGAALPFLGGAAERLDRAPSLLQDAAGLELQRAVPSITR